MVLDLGKINSVEELMKKEAEFKKIEQEEALKKYNEFLKQEKRSK